MKRLIRKILSCLMATIMIVSALNVLPISSNAKNSVKTQAEAVAWLKAQDGATYNFGDFYDDYGVLWGGTQCVEFVRAYVNWLLTGNPWSDCWNRPTGNGNNIWQNSLWAELGWTVYYNTPDFVPQPGDIFSAGINNASHTGVVISSDVYSAVLADSNARNTDWTDGDPVLVHTHAWSLATSDTAYGATHFIRPNFSGTSSSIEDHRPATPSFSGLKSDYTENDTITFSWSSDSNTTHTNFWLYAKDGNDWKKIEKIDYANSGLQRKLPVGEYRAEIVATNSNYWEEDGSTWLYSVSPFYYFNVNPIIDSSNIFEDVKSTSWFKQAVDYSVENGLMFGISNNRFDPDGSTTRAMFVTVLWRLEGKPQTNNNVPFTDIKENWYNDAVTWAYSNKIVSGTEYNKFSPDIKITREQMVAILYRYAKNKGYDISASTGLGTFPDSGNASSYARTALSWACGSGLIFGSDGKLLPQDGATRAQVAAILMRYTNKVVQK